MALTYEQLLSSAKKKGLSESDVLAKAKEMGIDINTGTGKATWQSPVKQTKAVLQTKNPTMKPIDYDQNQWNLANKQQIESANKDKGWQVDTQGIIRTPEQAAAQAAYNKNQPTSAMSWQSVQSRMELPEDTSGWTNEDFENFEWRKKVDELNQSLSQSFNNLAFDNKSFQNNVSKNMQTQMAKNNQLQEELQRYKTQVDNDFQLVRNKFDENTQAQMDRINELEKTYMNNLNEMRGLQENYYNTQQEALNARVGGEQAGLQGGLSARGIDQSVINDAITKARTKHLDQYNSLQEQNINTLNQLNEAYNTFANQINTQRKNLEDEDLGMIREKFQFHKDMAGVGTQYNQNLINNTFKPYEDAINEMLSKQKSEMGYEAQDQYIAERFNTSSLEEKYQLLQNKFTNVAGGRLTDIDMVILKNAAQQPSYPEALQYLANASKAVAETNQPSSLANAYSSGRLPSGGSAGGSAGQGAGDMGEGGTNIQDTIEDITSEQGASETQSYGGRWYESPDAYVVQKNGQYFGSAGSGLTEYPISKEMYDRFAPQQTQRTDALVGAGAVAGMPTIQPIDEIKNTQQSATSDKVYLNPIEQKINKLTQAIASGRYTNYQAKVLEAKLRELQNQR